MLEGQKWNFVFFKPTEGDYFHSTHDDSKQRSKQKIDDNYSGIGRWFSAMRPRCVDA